ncbi:MAG: hypothetical protein WB491_04365 [Candidatus Aquilonibacter sp.]
MPAVRWSRVVRVLLGALAFLGAVLALHPWIADPGTRLVVVAAAWLALETRWLRIVSNKQTTILADERRAQRTPILLSGYRANEDDSNPVVTAINPTNCPALNVGAFFYDPTVRHFTMSTVVVDYFSPNDRDKFALDPKAKSANEVARQLSNQYNLAETNLMPYLTGHRFDADQYYAAVIYETPIGEIFLALRHWAAGTDDSEAANITRHKLREATDVEGAR